MASEKNALGHCERCGWRYPLAQLLYEVQPDKEDLRVCPECFDPYNVRSDPEAYNVDEDTSLDDPTFDVDRVSMFSWAPVGNVEPLRAYVLYTWLG